MRRLFLLLLFASATAIAPPPERERWTSLTVDDLTIYSNAGDAVTRKVALNLKRMRDAVGVVSKLRVRSPFPTHVYLFANERSFAPWRDALIGSENVVGLFFSGRGANFVLLRGDVRSERVVYHELAHSFLRNTVSRVPLWFSEGFAELYSTFESNGNVVKVGLPIQTHLDTLKHEQTMSLKDLFAVTQDSKDYHEGVRQGVFYAESWALVHYLLIGNPERRDQIGVFLGLVNANRPVEEAFRTAFHVSYDDMERELRAYVRRFEMSYVQYTLAGASANESFAIQPMARDAVLFELGDVLLHAGAATLRDAQTMLEAAVKVNPSNADALADLGLVASRQRRFDDADALLARAVALEPRDELPYLAYGWSLLDREKDVAKARQLFEKALALHPNSARALEGLGETYAADPKGDVARGIDALQKSLALAPSQPDAVYNLLVLYVRAGRRADAESMLSQLQSLAPPKVVEEARQLLTNITPP